MSNYKVVSDAVQREFPDKQFVYTTVQNEDGTQSIVAVEQKVGNFIHTSIQIIEQVD